MKKLKGGIRGGGMTKIDYNNEEFQDKLIAYVKFIDRGCSRENALHYDKKRRELHKGLFDFFDIKIRSKEGEHLGLCINKSIIVLSNQSVNKKLAMISSCQNQEELDLVERKLKFFNKWGG